MANTFYAVKHLQGKFLKLSYVTKSTPRSLVSLTDSNFPVWNSKSDAEQYIEDGKELFYSYEDVGLDSNDFEVVNLYESVDHFSIWELKRDIKDVTEFEILKDDVYIIGKRNVNKEIAEIALMILF